MKAFALEESWELIRQVLPADLEALARQSGSFQRARKVGDARTLVRLLLMHASGLSLAQTALRAQAQGLAKLSAVALFKRLRRSGAFLQRLAVHLLEPGRQCAAPVRWPGGYRFRLIDATTGTEPGPKGRTWRLHASLRRPALDCDPFALTDLHAGERFKRWQAAPNEVRLADRAYARREARGALLAQGGQVVGRSNGRSLPLLTAQGQPFKPKAHLRKLKVGQVQEWPLFFRAGGQTWPLRLWAIRQSRLATEGAQRKARRKAQPPQREVSADALARSKYVLVLTNLAPQTWSAAQVLELSGCRWQIELAFKRLKSLLQLGQLPKQDPASARAGLQLKLLLALIIEGRCHQARFFSPGAIGLRLSRGRAWQERGRTRCSRRFGARCPWLS